MVKVVGTAGAGDAFVSTLAFYLHQGVSPKSALQAAVRNSASVISHVDTQTGLLSHEALSKGASNDNILSIPLRDDKG